MSAIRIGIVGLGANTKLRHVPGLRACRDVQIIGVCNRRPESTAAAAAEFNIPKTYARWEELIADADIDAVVIGTWPYLHCPITLAALEAGKHVLTEARMAMNLAEARQMLAASQAHPELTTQIVHSPLGLRAGGMVRQMLDDGFVGDLREVVVLGVSDALADSSAPLHWRQQAEYSGLNVLALGILHETLTRWVAHPSRVRAQVQTFTAERRDPDTLRPVTRPDCAHVLTEMPDGARGVYHLSGAVYHGPSMQIHLYGSSGAIKYEFAPQDRLLAARSDEKQLREIDPPGDKAGRWRVEEEFVNAIRGREQIKLTDFATGVRYMEFTEAVARSAETGAAVSLPLDA